MKEEEEGKAEPKALKQAKQQPTRKRQKRSLMLPYVLLVFLISISHYSYFLLLL